MFSNIQKPSVLTKLPGSINGQQFIVEDCRDCDIFLLDNCTSVQIDACQFRSRDCANIEVYLYSATEPIIETSTHMRFACFPLTYFSLQQQFDRANFSVWNNKWSEIYNFTPDHGAWKPLQMTSDVSPLAASEIQRLGNGVVSLWKLPAAIAESIGLSIEISQLVVPLSCGMSAGRDDAPTVFICFVVPNQQPMLDFVAAMVVKEPESAAVEDALEAAKDGDLGSVMLEFQRHDCYERARPHHIATMPSTPTAARSPSPTKRSRDDDGTDSVDTSSKRSRRTRWEHESAPSPAAPPTGPSAKDKLSAIVARLSGVVKEKSAPSYLLPTVPAAPVVPLDADAAKARALAQASLLALNLPVTQVSPSDLARRLYIGNLYYDLKEDDIRNTFAPFGQIKSIDLSLEPGHNRSKGFCFLEFEDVLAAETAVQLLNGSQLANRTIRVGRPHRGSSNPGDTSIGQQAIKDLPTKCIYVGNVRVELNSHHLESIFSPFGVIRTCVMAALAPLESNAHRGYGFLEFTEESAAQNAIQHMNGFELAGQNLRVGKASAAAIAINLATSSDRVVRGENGELGASAGLAPKKGRAFDDDDVEGVKDVAEPGREKRCLCLLNLVGNGEVDDELEGEVREECGRFGAVETVAIHEMEAHVRVFVLFEDEPSALKAKQALHGRFFGGNQVQAHFYPVEELAAKRYRSDFVV
ncbi:hypothetical protein PybrP1_010711 [[Pythium] brassicae (nom. inval.)]|nr:hypothetical protein PybrP1_010711 [[Pythium] brassicae (nom. inval.)]